MSAVSGTGDRQQTTHLSPQKMNLVMGAHRTPCSIPKCLSARACVFLATNLHSTLQLHSTRVCSELWTGRISLESAAPLPPHYPWPVSLHLFGFQGRTCTHACQAPWPRSHACWNGSHPHCYVGGGPAAPSAMEAEASSLLQCKPFWLFLLCLSIIKRSFLSILGPSLTQAVCR